MTILKAYNSKRGQTSLRSVWENPWHFIACGFGVGTIPVMPGTFGSLVGVLVYLILRQYSLVVYLSSVFVLLGFGVYLCGRVNRDLGTDDHPAAVWDEIAAFPLVMVGIPATWQTLLLGFVLFRLFDIWKPQPIRWLDRHVHGGIGVMIDDVAAALLAWLVLFLLAGRLS